MSSHTYFPLPRPAHLILVAVVGTPSAAPLVTLAEVKAHCRVDFATDDAVLQTMVDAAQAQVERWLNRTFAVRTLRAVYSGWPLDCQGRPDALTLPRPPIVSVTSVGGLLPADLQVTSNGDTCRLRPLAAAWPADDGEITAEYQAGYTTLPAPLKMAVLWLAAHWYEHRESVGTTQMFEMPLALQSILESWKNPEAA